MGRRWALAFWNMLEISLARTSFLRTALRGVPYATWVTRVRTMATINVCVFMIYMN